MKLHDIFIDDQGVNMGGYSKEGRHLQLVDIRGVEKIVSRGSANWL